MLCPVKWSKFRDHRKWQHIETAGTSTGEAFLDLDPTFSIVQGKQLNKIFCRVTASITCVIKMTLKGHIFGFIYGNCWSVSWHSLNYSISWLGMRKVDVANLLSLYGRVKQDLSKLKVDRSSSFWKTLKETKEKQKWGVEYLIMQVLIKKTFSSRLVGIHWGVVGMQTQEEFIPTQNPATTHWGHFYIGA